MSNNNIIITRKEEEDEPKVADFKKKVAEKHGITPSYHRVLSKKQKEE